MDLKILTFEHSFTSGPEVDIPYATVRAEFSVSKETPSGESLYKYVLKESLPSHVSPWRHIPETDTFLFTETVSLTSVTRAIIEELTHFTKNGRFAEPYRTSEEWIALQHLIALERYWD